MDQVFVCFLSTMKVSRRTMRFGLCRQVIYVKDKRYNSVNDLVDGTVLFPEERRAKVIVKGMKGTSGVTVGGVMDSPKMIVRGVSRKFKKECRTGFPLRVQNPKIMLPWGLRQDE